MTCKDCKLWNSCTDANKGCNEDGDSWANWCDGFRSIHRTRIVRNGEYRIVQSGYNWHIMVIHEPTEKMLLHVSANKKCTKRELFDMVDFYHEVLKWGKEIIENGHGEDTERN